MQKMMVTITTLILMSAWIAVAAEDNTFFDKAQHYSNSVGDLTKLYVNQVNSPTGNYSLDDLLHDMGEHVDSSSITGKPKHILVVLTDDQGWADVGFRDESFVSPAMDYLATNGVILENFYVQSSCSPTRASLLTGRYATRTGLQDGAIIPGEDRSLPTDIPIMSTHLKSMGYSTYLVGKWHIGQTYISETPNGRDYDRFFGILGGAVDYYGKDIGRDCGTPENGFRSVFADNCQFINAYDLQEDGVPFIDTTTYLTDLLGDKAVQYIQEHDNTQPMLMNYHLTGPHTPMQAPVELINICNNVTPTYASVQPTYRQILCGMVASVDINLLRVLLALAVKGMLESTLIVFMSDNGGLELAGSVNQPFRGGKLTEFEGGLRVPAFLYGKELFPANRLTPIRKDLVHVADILPTILDYAGFPLFTLGQDIDGINNWLQLMAGTPFVRDFIPINDASKIVLYTGGYIKILKGVMWKYLFNPSFLGQLAIIPNEQPLNYQPEGEMLFNLSDDPYETTNLVPTVRGPYMSFVLWYLRTLKWSQGLGRGVSPELLQFPPPVSVPPSQGGCWLPLDSPFYNTFICPV